MDYWVYKNWTEKHAYVHKATCRDCNNGEGQNKPKGDQNGEWKGFDTYQQAYDYALNYINSTGCDNTQINCQHCHPEA